MKNEVVRKNVGLKCLKIKIDYKRLQWYGYMKRMGDDRLPKRAFEWEETEKGLEVDYVQDGQIKSRLGERTQLARDSIE